MTPFDQRFGVVLRLLVVGIFGVTNVNMQNRHVTLNAPPDNFDSGYPDTGTIDTAWQITVESDHQILLQFLDFSLNETASCTVDVLQLYNGNRDENVLVDCFCWDDVMQLTSTAYISSSNQFYIRLITKEGYSRKGFRAHYTTVNLQHTPSSGEIMSPGYPNTGLLDEAWRIKVNEDDNIRMELLDFALDESDPCNHDYFELYDGVCNQYRMLGRWCWNSFDKLTQTVYISSGNVFYLRLRTQHNFHRRGFKASYSSISNDSTDVTETGSVYCGFSKLATPSANKDPTQSTLSNSTDVTKMSSLNYGYTSATIPSDIGTQKDLRGSTSSAVSDTSSKPNGTPASTVSMTQPMPDLLIYIIPVIVGILIILCVVLGFCCYCSKSKRSNKQDSEAPPTTEFHELTTNEHVKDQYDEETSTAKTGNNSSADNTEKTKDTSSSTNRGYIPTYALPNRKNGQVKETKKDERLNQDSRKFEQKIDMDNAVQKADGSSQSSDILDPTYDTPGEGNENDTRIKDANKSNSMETENVSNETQAKHDYAYINRNTVKGEDKSTDVIYSFPDKKKNERRELVSNVAYESFDAAEEESMSGIEVDEVPYSLPHKEKRESEEMVINEAYQSYDSDENKSNKGDDTTYYDVDENDRKEIGEPKELLYDSINI